MTAHNDDQEEEEHEEEGDEEAVAAPAPAMDRADMTMEVQGCSPELAQNAILYAQNTNGRSASLLLIMGALVMFA